MRFGGGLPRWQGQSASVAREETRKRTLNVVFVIDKRPDTPADELLWKCRKLVCRQYERLIPDDYINRDRWDRSQDFVSEKGRNEDRWSSVHMRVLEQYDQLLWIVTDLMNCEALIH